MAGGEGLGYICAQSVYLVEVSPLCGLIGGLGGVFLGKSFTEPVVDLENQFDRWLKQHGNGCEALSWGGINHCMGDYTQQGSYSS